MLWIRLRRKWRRWARLINARADFCRLLESPLIDVNQATKAALAVLQQEGFSKPVHAFVGVVAASQRLHNPYDIAAGPRASSGWTGRNARPTQGR